MLNCPTGEARPRAAQGEEHMGQKGRGLPFARPKSRAQAEHQVAQNPPPPASASPPPKPPASPLPRRIPGAGPNPGNWQQRRAPKPGAQQAGQGTRPDPGPANGTTRASASSPAPPAIARADSQPRTVTGSAAGTGHANGIAKPEQSAPARPDAPPPSAMSRGSGAPNGPAAGRRSSAW